MHPNEYATLAMRTQADQEKILKRLVELGPRAMQLDNAARGLAGDAGEVSSAVMKYIEYGRELDRVNLLEEVGDCLWRLAQVCEAVGLTLEEAMEANIRKLQARYPTKYTDEASANRNKEAERKALEEKGYLTGSGGLEVALDEKEVSIRKTAVCDHCRGTGYVDCEWSTCTTPCPKCSGGG